MYSHLYNHYELKGVLLEGKPKSIWHTMRSYWGCHNNELVEKLQYHVKSFTKPEAMSRSWEPPAEYMRESPKSNDRHSNKF